MKKNVGRKKVGVSSEVYSFTKDEIEKMIRAFDEQIRIVEESEKDRFYEIKRERVHKNKLLFIIGINVGIKLNDIRMLQWSFFFDEDKNFKDFYVIYPKNMSEKNKCIKLYFNQEVKDAVSSHIEKFPINDINEYIFTGAQFMTRLDTPITVQTIWNMLKATAIEADIDKNIGTHSLRKTWGYQIWENANNKLNALLLLQKCYNHPTLQATKKYLGIDSII